MTVSYLEVAKNDFRGREVAMPCSPYAVEDVTVGKDSHVNVVHENGMKVALLFVPEERVRHPDLARIRQGEILESTYEETVRIRRKIIQRLTVLPPKLSNFNRSSFHCSRNVI